MDEDEPKGEDNSDNEDFDVNEDPEEEDVTI